VGHYAGELIGVIEYIESEKIADYNWSKLYDLPKEKRCKFLCSAAGAFVAGHTLTLTDRHVDNMKIKINEDGTPTYLQIDFEHVFDDRSYLGPPVAIHQQLRKELQKRGDWNDFLAMCVKAFMLLRKFYGMINEFCLQLFSQNINNANEQIPKLLAQSLMLGQSNDFCRARIRDIFDKAPEQLGYRFKSFVHIVGQPITQVQENDKKREIYKIQAIGLSSILNMKGTARKYIAKTTSMVLAPEIQHKWKIDSESPCFSRSERASSVRNQKILSSEHRKNPIMKI